MIYPIDIPLEVSQVLGFTHGGADQRPGGGRHLRQPGAGPHLSVPQVGEAMAVLKEFMFANVYTNPIAKGEESKAQDMLKMLFGFYKQTPQGPPADFRRSAWRRGWTGRCATISQDDRPLRGERVHPAVHPPWDGA